MKILTACLVTAISVAAAPVWAQEISLGDIKAKGAAKLGKDELNALIPGSTVDHAGAQIDKTWTNDKDGSVVGSSSRRADPAKRGSGRGTWRVTDDGKYCVDIEWRLGTEQWCRFLYRHGDDYVAFRTDTDLSAKGMVLKIRK